MVWLGVSISDDDCNISDDCSTDDRHTPNPRPARIKGALTHLKDYYVHPLRTSPSRVPHPLTTALAPHSLPLPLTTGPTSAVTISMADHKTRKTTTDRLEEAIARLTNSQVSINDRYNDLAGKVDLILEHLHLHASDNNTNTTTSSYPNHQRSAVKIDIPRFDGRDPLGWIFKITQLFQYQNTPEDERITVASLYLDGAALSWYQWMYINWLITTWNGFLQALESRFAPTFYEDPKRALFKLTQTSTVNEYLTDFERFANRVVGLPPSFLLSCFISRLKPDVQREVLALQPILFLQASALAKLQEEKLRDRTFLPARNSIPPNRPSIARLRCKGWVLLFIADEQPSPPDSTDHDFVENQTLAFENDPAPSSDIDSHISLHALVGVPSSETFQIYGMIKNARLTVLVDNGSTHNFLQPRIAQFLKLSTQNTHPLQVMVGNGSMLACDQICPSTNLTIQGHPFMVSFHLLQISGADAVLGIDWLRRLGPVTTNYADSIMSFNHLGHDITLREDVSIGPEPTSAAQLKRLLQTGSTSALYQLHVLPVTEPEQPAPPHPIPAMEHLLLRYNHLFQKPSTIPPPRQVVHCITLKPATPPITVRPYRYPHFQKNKIENQVSELLAAGLIRPSTSPYSSQCSS
ncbi:uncharacterized protein LOC114411353 [Glycine soja]|uniref:uncharacterized protein LOC114411353 n=1 Tax=Glycine soja TaxID=3848 RepID=UPI0010393F85|nr:uncharacterized protein LOC114411353 [Glycine soja]